MQQPKPALIAVMGPTACGKSALAERIATELDAQLINADAFQVYKWMDIGTAKPERRDAYKLLDFKDPREQFGLGEWIVLAQEELNRLWLSHRSAVIVGGTGLYVRALFEQYTDIQPSPDPKLREWLEKRPLEALWQELLQRDPEAATKVDRHNPLRVRRALERTCSNLDPIKIELPPFHRIKLGLDCEHAELKHQIRLRVQAMLEAGWLEEADNLKKLGVPDKAPGMKAIGYRTLYRVLDYQLSIEEAEDEIVTETQQYAKRQRTWLRSEPNLHGLAEGPDLLAQAMRSIEAAKVPA